MMETIYDVLRLLVAKAGGGRILEDEAAAALEVIARDEAAHAAAPAAEPEQEAPVG